LCLSSAHCEVDRTFDWMVGDLDLWFDRMVGENRSPGSPTCSLDSERTMGESGNVLFERTLCESNVYCSNALVNWPTPKRATRTVAWSTNLTTVHCPSAGELIGYYRNELLRMGRQIEL
jgi:hypothetical protein